MGNLTTGVYLIRHSNLINVKVAAPTPFGSHDQAMAIRDDWPELAGIINRCLAVISEKKRNEILTQYLGIVPTNISQAGQLKQNPPLADEEKSFTEISPKEDALVHPKRSPQLPFISFKRMVTLATFAFFTVGLLGFILINVLRKENIAISFGSPWFRGLVLTSLTVFVLIVALLGWYNLEQNKTQHLEGIDMTLRERLLVIQDRLDLWLKERISYVERLGKDPALVAIAKDLLKLDTSKKVFLQSHALETARVFFENNQEIFPNIGFFIINKDHINIGAMRDSNIGIKNFISEQHPELLRQAFQGKVDLYAVCHIG